MNDGRMMGLGLFVIVVLVAMMGLFGSYYTVDQGERGVILRQGEIHLVTQPGWGLKIPFVDHVVRVDVRTHKMTYNNLGSYSNDIQLANLRVSVNFHIDPAETASIYAKYGSVKAAVDRIITPRISRDVKIVFGQFTAPRAVAERDRLNHEVDAAIKESTKGTGLIVENVLIENIDFSKAFENSIEERMKAEVEVARLKQNLEREKVQADIKRTQAAGEADKIRAEAKARADAVRMQGEATAAAITARGEALRKNPELVELVKAERWDGQFPTTMIPGTATPFLQMK